MRLRNGRGLVARHQALVHGRFVAVAEPPVPELRRLTQAMNTMVERVRAQFDAQAALVEQLRQQANCDAVTGLANRQHFLGQLGAAWRRRFDLPLIAVTGSNGKTTVTQMIAAILRAYRPQAMLATEGNLNNEIGVPLTVLRLRPGHELAVVELGMNHPGEIAGLAAIAQPTVALVNNAQREHQEFMASIEAVARENGAVIEALAANGTAVFPADDAYSALWHDLSGMRPQLTFALTPDTQAADLSCVAPQWINNAWQVQAHTPAGLLTYTLQVAGLHNVKNSLAAAACALAAGVPLADIARGLEAFEPVKGRSRALAVELTGRAITVVDDSYNANPDSVRAAIDVLAGLPGPRLLVLGDMGEVGEQGLDFHLEVLRQAMASGIESVHCTGDWMAQAVQALRDCGEPAPRHWDDIDALVEHVRESVAATAGTPVRSASTCASPSCSVQPTS